MANLNGLYLAQHSTITSIQIGPKMPRVYLGMTAYGFREACLRELLPALRLVEVEDSEDYLTYHGSWRPICNGASHGKSKGRQASHTLRLAYRRGRRCKGHHRQVWWYALSNLGRGQCF
jgi:hypothetical protein